MSKKVFVTGATGFLGSYLTRYLVQEGYTVRGLKRKTSRMDLVQECENQVEWIEGDILDVPLLEEAIQDCDWVFHCAAIVSFDPKMKQSMMDINIKGTANVVNICLHHNIEKLIHVSSIAALGRPEHETHITENTKWIESKYNTAYAESKFKSELEVWRGSVEGLNVGIVNPSVILGAGFWEQGSCKLFQKVADGLSFYTEGSNGFVDVRDVAQSMILLAKSSITNERYIINGVNMKFKDFFEEISVLMNKPLPSRKVTPFLGAMAWRLEKIRSFFTGKAPLLTKETVRTASLSYQYSNEKSIQQLEMNYRLIQKTIAETVEVFQETGGNSSYLSLK